MKISKSKRQLAQLIIEAGIKEFPNGADWAAQGSTDLKASFYSGYKPKRGFGEAAFCGSYCGSRHDVQLPSLINNWHQTVLSRDEFDRIVAETAPDADGWIEWSGKPKSPVENGVLVDVKLKGGGYHEAELLDDASWSDAWGDESIVAYRLHKQAEPEFCESVMRTIPEPEAKPSIEQLAADYHSAKDRSERKQQEADAAKDDVDAKLKALEMAGEALGLLVSPITAKQEPELVITDWRDLQLGDVVWYGGDDGLSPGEYRVMGIEASDYEGYLTVLVNYGDGGHWIDTRAGWGFIRRP